MSVVKTVLVGAPRDPPMATEFPPPGLGYLAATLRAAGRPVRVVDAAALGWDALATRLRDEQPDLVGIPCWSIDRAQAFRVAQLARRVVPRARIIFGGHHATAYPHHARIRGGADFVALGPAESTLLAVVERLEQGGGGYDDIPGLVHWEDGEQHASPRAPAPADLDAIPFPRYEDFELADYNGLPEVDGPAAAIITSRGCPYDCGFCGSTAFWQRRWHHRSAEHVLDEIGYLVKRFGIRGMWIYDDNFVIRRDRAIAICEGIRSRGWDLRWVAEASCRNVDRELLAHMKAAGCYRVEFGVESGSQAVLDGIGKPLKVDDVRRSFALCHEVGIQPRALLMVGNPGETEDTIDETIALMRDVSPYYTVSAMIAMALPDTDLFRRLEKAGRVDERFWLDRDDVPFFTAEHDLPRLEAMRDRLMRGLARNRGTVLAWAEYAFLREYHRNAMVRVGYHRYLARMTGLFRLLHRR